MNSSKRWIECGLILLILALGLLVRLEDIRDWEAQPQRALYQGEPLLTTFDGYYYLTLARDLAENTYRPVDEKRAVPDCPPRPQPPPLLSEIASLASQISSVSFNWIGAVTPAVLGILLFFPIYGIGRFYGGSVMAASAGLFGIMSFYYVYRSSLGWFDTDCMNVTFAMSAVFFALKFGETKDSKRYLWFAGAIVNYILFLWWWDQTPQVTTVVALLPLVAALVFFYRPSKREGMVFLGLLLAGVLGVLALKGMNLPIKTVQGIVNSYKYISKQVQGDFPNIGVTISEQIIPTLPEIVAKTTDNTVTFFLSLIGLGLLFWRYKVKGIYLAVPALLAALSFFFAKRFMIFLAPTLALGGGFIISEIWALKGRYKVAAPAAVLAALIFVVPSFQKDMTKTFWPKEPPHIIAGMAKAGGVTPDNAVLWAWWDHGYPMIYWAKRATINDGQVHGGERSVFNGLPLAAGNERLAANMMQFFVERGIKNGTHKVYKACGDDAARGFNLIKAVMAAGPDRASELIESARLQPQGTVKTTEDWLRFFFPAQSRPIYLFLDWRLTVTNYWWFWLGSWDPESHDGIHPAYASFYGVKIKDGKIFGASSSGQPMIVDIEKGMLRFGSKEAPIKKLFLRYPKRVETKNYNRQKGLNFEAALTQGYAAAMNDPISKSVFNKLFLRHVFNPGFFEPVVLHTPSYQIWKVKAEHYTGTAVTGLSHGSSSG